MIYKSFRLNFLVEKYEGMAIHKNKTKNDITNPKVVPKKFLKIAPVYPIIAEASKCNNIWILAKSIGLKEVINIIGFSIG